MLNMAAPTRIIRNIFDIFRKSEHLHVQKEISKCDVFLEHVFKILCWEDNAYTLKVFLTVNFIFWLVVYWQINVLGLVFLATLALFLCDTYIEHKQSELYKGEFDESLEEFYNICSDVFLNLKALRKDNPSSFAIGMSLTFFILSIVARSMSGYLVCYLVILSVFFLPLGFKNLPERYVSQLKSIVRNVASVPVLAENELIPYISNKKFDGQDPELDSLLTDKTQDSVSNSFTSGLSTMPSHLDVIDSKDSIEEDDLIPQNKTPGDLSSDSDSDNRGIHFDLKHFNGDSSSEEERLHGLSFPSVPVESLIPNTSEGIITLGKNLLTSIIKGGSQSPKSKKELQHSSSESEFEIISEDEVNN